MTIEEVKILFDKTNCEHKNYYTIKSGNISKINNILENFNPDDCNAIFLFNNDPSSGCNIDRTSNKNINNRINNEFFLEIAKEMNCNERTASLVYSSGEFGLNKNEVGKSILKDIYSYDYIFDCIWGC